MLDPKLHISHNLPITGKKICSIGNWGHHNFGDELILIGLIQLFFQNKSIGNNIDSQLYVSGGDIPFLKKFHAYFFENKELQFLHYIQEIPHGFRSGFRFLTKSLNDFGSYLRCDTFIIGGGELFTEETPGSYLYWLCSLSPYFLRKLFFWKTKLYIMGGIQSPKNCYNKLILRLLSSCANGIFPRDEESVKVAQQYGNKHVSRFIDTSYFTPIKNKVATFSLVEYGKNLEKSTGARHCIVNTNPLSQERTQQLVQIIDQETYNGSTVYFLPAFFTTNTQQDDMICYDKLKKLYPDLQLLDRRNREQFLSVFTTAQKIYCSRLHVFLVAAFLGLDVQPYPYQKKINKNISLLKKCGIIRNI